MTIAKRLTILIATAIAALLLLAGVNHQQMEKVYEATNYTAVNVVPSIIVLGDTLNNFGLVRVRAYRHVLQSDPAAMRQTADKIGEARQALEKNLKDYEPLISDAEDKRLLDQERAAIAEYYKGLDHVIETSQAGKKDEARELLLKYVSQATKVDDSLIEHVKYNDHLANKATAAGATTKSHATWVATAISVIALVITALLGLTIIRGLLSRLAAANRIAERIAGSDLTHHPEAESNDEIGHLLRSLEKMRSDLAATIRAIASEAEVVATSSAQLSTAAGQVAASSEGQSQSTASAAAAVEELTVSIDHVGNSADDASQRANEAETLAVASGKDVDQASDQIFDVAKKVEQTAQQIQALSGQVQKIGNVTVVIREVADQTNLLALNAAIEAARAGEQGRGFAVVADEVRKLAERTTQSVQEIAAMISAIQSEAASAVSSMQSSRDVVGEVVSSAERASGSMQGIRASAEIMQASINGISDALREQRSASIELARNVEAVAQMSEENASAVASVSATAGQLVDVSGKLKQSVARFRL